MEITEKVCPVLDEEWMQGRMMDTGKFTLERAQTIHGNMNPVLGRGFEPLPQEDDKRLSRIVRQQQDAAVLRRDTAPLQSLSYSLA